MTIDERIEALTQSVELLAHMHRDHEQAAAKETTELREQVKTLTAGTADLKEAAFALLTVAGNHERRLQRIEGENGGGGK